MKKQFDIVIVGGGAVGAALALQLQPLGYRIAVVESREPLFESSDPERVIALSYGSRVHLEQLGVWPEVAAAGSGLIRHIVVSEPGNAGRVDMDAIDARHEAPDIEALGYVVEMGQLLAPMYARMHDCAQVICPASVTALQQTDDGVELRLQQGEKSDTLHARLVIGADGTQSQMRRMAGIDLFGWDYNRYGIVASVACERSHDDVAYECFRESGPLALLPLADGRFSIVWAATPSEAVRLLQMPEAAFLQKLYRVVGDAVQPKSGRFTAMGGRASYPLELSVARSYTAPRLLLAGNAAHTVHPVGGQGMNLGLRDVALLARVLDSDLARQDPGAPILLQAYAEQRRLDVLGVTGFTESMVNAFGTSFAPGRWLRGQGLNAMQMWPPLRDLLLHHAAGLSSLAATGENQ
jgi:ubiquinone biosynthesis UbiH/UbiF/VisC/COQ6 family hydroxylase